MTIHFWVYTQKNWEQGLQQLLAHVHSSITHSGHKVEATPVSTDRVIRMAYSNKMELLFSLKHEGSSDRC